MKKTICFGSPVYPSPTAGRGERLGISPLRRCVQCGTPNDTRKTPWSDSAEADPVRNAGGCKFCGSLMWTHDKPAILPDDRKLPTRDRKMERTGGE